MRLELWVPCAALLAASASSACSPDSATGGGGEGSATSSSASTGTAGGGAGGAPNLASFTPEGCAFSIAPRVEYQGFVRGDAKNGAHPNIRRVRLGLGGNVTPGAAGHADPAHTIGFAWQTDDDGTLASDVAWGTDPDPSKWPAKNRASGVTWLTPASSFTTSPPERMHEAYVCGLEPSTTYYYRVGGGPAGAETWSDVLSFATTPEAGPTKVKLGVTGDSRSETNDAWHLVQQRMKLAGTTLDVFSGDAIDIAFDQDEWEKWLDNAAKDDAGYLTLGTILTLATHGNHEAHTSLFYGNLALPQEPATYADDAELFYSVDVGPVHLVVFDDFWIANAEANTAFAPVLTRWLDADLTAAVANRGAVPWIVTVHHHGPYSSSDHGADLDVLRARAYLTPIYDKYKVDLDVAGHDHNYERTKPLTGPATSPTVHANPGDGTTYFICAGSGAPAYGSGSSAFTAANHGFDSGGGLGVYAFVTADATTLTLEAHELRGDASDPVIDTFTVTK